MAECPPPKWFCVLFAAFVAGPPAAPATASDLLAARLDLRWTVPISANRQGSEYDWTGIRIDALAVGPDGRAIAYAETGGTKLLLLDPLNSPRAISAGIDDPPPPWLRRRWPWPPAIGGRSVSGFAVDAGGIWLGGFANSSMDLSSRVTRDAYVARLDRFGRRRWEQVTGDGKGPQIEQLASDGRGGIVGVGGSGDSGNRTARLLRIDAEGASIATHDIGLGDGQAIARLRDGGFLVAGQASTSKSPNGPAFLATWRLAPDNRLSPALPVAGLPIGNARDHYTTTMVPAGDGAYLTAARPYPGQDPVSVFRLDRSGQSVWHVTLPNTVRQRADLGRSVDGCEAALVTLPDGAALVGCALAGRLDLYRLAARDGAVTSVSLPLPACQREHPARILMVRQADGSIVVAGTRRGSNVAANCSWVGRLRLG